MAEIQYQYAYDETGKLVSIKNYTKEESKLHSYKCISCGNELLPRAIGSNKRKAHFYHRTLIECSGETYLHKLGKLLIKQKFETSETFLVSYPVTKECSNIDCSLRNSNCKKDPTEEIFDLKKFYDTCTEETSVKGFVADLLLTNSQKANIPPILIEICVTHSCEYNKRNSGLKIIELTLKNEDDVIAIVEAKVIQEPIYKIGKKKKVEFISFNWYINSPMENTITRYIFRPKVSEIGYTTLINCKDAIYKLFTDSFVELNIVNTMNNVDILIPLLWMSKNKHLRRCLICKFYYATMYEDTPICRLSKKYGKPKFPAMTDAELCKYFEAKGTFLNVHFENCTFDEVTKLPLEIKEEYRVIIAGSHSFSNYDLFKKKCEHYLSAKKTSHQITILCGTSFHTEEFIRRYCHENAIYIQPYEADWNRFGQNAGYKSNEIMIKQANALIAFWDGKSKIIENLIYLAKKNGLRTAVVKY